MFNSLLLLFTLVIPLENKTSTLFNFGGGFNLTTIFTVLLIIGWMTNRRANTPLLAKNPINLPLTLFLATTYLSFFTGFVQLGIPFFGNEFRSFKILLTLFILFFIVANNVKEKKGMKLLLGIMTVMVTLTAIVVQKEFRESGIWHYDEEARIRVFGMQPNMLGAFFAQFLPILAAFAFLTNKFKNRIFYIFLFSIGLSGLMFTYSRGAYLGIAGALIVMAILGGKKSLKGFVLLFAIAILAQSILFGHGRLIPVSVRERIEMVQGEKMQKDVSAQLRKEVWELAKKYIRESPIVGYGYGASDHLLYLEDRDIRLDTHNMYLDIALECGIPTLLLFIWLLIRAIKVAFTLYKRTNDDFYKIVTLGFMGSVVALTIGNLFGTRLILLAANGYFAILMGMVAQIYTQENTIRGLNKTNTTLK